ncbi:hypothetical protein [Pedobacter sp. Leaf194]|uniref:hypothetical protein n=1 Tax=Pedobacter sp. Leaf194 TaxID=1736297 RepID=UPI0007035BCB|nr:hypothetical protein [Pedobacter sp. Leaf194]KQS36205.1 hypothetical protein ASG14_12300 [Pedobacter sp. Leaf194]
MKNYITNFLSLTIIFILIASRSFAQTPREGGVRYSVGADVGLPIGTFSDTYKWSLGGSVQADIPIAGNQLYVTINAGYNNVFADKSLSAFVDDVHLIPVKAGLKYFAVSNFYVQGEAGVSFLLDRDNEKSASFVYAPQVGYLIPLGGKSYLDTGVRFEGNSKFSENGSSNNVLALRVAYAFPIGQ